ncbi:hypothetical protein [Halorubrum sp. GN12_10-3_MGM]|uniref:hypothetical protein n=1 Tax=Halorubrum sp. GN12_10-3_MGM TaxID=2518113 RepID=UPI0010F5EF02|nr:hypothetical protein [Halorubrum sp. GN12_10-3_MGM]TKX64320.1 hypothetical protein EXE47_11385 [Halorubrum sp. GN12_10-3_MGM]
MLAPVTNLLILLIFLSFLVYPSGRLHRSGIQQLLIRFFALLPLIVEFVQLLIDTTRTYTKTIILSGGVYISTIAPRIGAYILEKGNLVSYVQARFDSTYREEMLTQRLEYRKMFVRHGELADDLPDYAEIIKDAVEARKTVERRYSIGEVVIGVGGGVIALVVGFVSPLAGVALLITMYMTLFPISMLLRSIIVDTLCFSGNPYDIENEERGDYRYKTVVFMKGWNEMFVNRPSVMHKLILVSVVRGEFTEGHQLGQQLVEQAYAEDITVSEGLDEVVEEEFGEDTVESRWTRKLIERFIGV